MDRRKPGRGRVQLGRIVGVHGLQGWVKVHSYTDPREGILAYRPLIVADESVNDFEGRVHGKGLQLRLAGCEDRSAVEHLVGSAIEVERSQLPETDDNEYYWSDLEGLDVIDLAGNRLGRVQGLIATGANDVLDVRGGERSLLIPFVQGVYVRRVDLANGELVVDWDPEWS